MPKRKRLIRFPSPEIQGEDSWVIVALLTVEEMRKARKQGKKAKTDDGIDMFELGVDVLRTHVREWNWVDDDDVPFPQPKDDHSIIEKLSEPETDFLAALIYGSEKDAKN